MPTAEEILAAKREEAAKLTEAFVALFSAERNGITLSPDVVQAISIHLAAAGVKGGYGRGPR